MSFSEFEIIRRHFIESGLGFPKTGVVMGIGDDAAVLDLPADSVLTISMDVLVESVHFPTGADPRLIANRALSVNLSDLAAMAAEPFCFTLGLVLPRADSTWLDGFSRGLLDVAEQFDCPLVGGDTTRCPADGQINISIQVHGLSQRNRVVRRDGAKPGDRIYVSGCLGDGAIALLHLGLQSHLGDSFELRATDCRPYFEQAYYQPQPRIELARNCAGYVSSGIDISDGLYGDLGHIIEASAVGAKLNSSQFPYSDAAHSCVTEQNRLRAALYGGDDYELCLTVPPQHAATVEQQGKDLGIAMSCIGEIVDGDDIQIYQESGALLEIETSAYDHFRAD